MNARVIKKIRKEARRQSIKRDSQILPELKAYINQQKWTDRVKMAWRILCAKF